MPRVVLCTALLLAAVHSITSIIINGRRWAMDEMIYEAGMMSGSAGVFDLIQDENTMLLELDMLVNRNTYNEMYTVGTQRLRKKRRALTDPETRWPNARVPYEISNQFTGDEKDLIRGAMDEYEQYTCLKFVKATKSDKDKIRFVSGKKCQSEVGKIGGTQEITLARNDEHHHCREHGLILHEIGHAIGWLHEHNRPDRDEYITINRCNIKDDMYDNFNATYDEGYINTYGVPYDYYSIMHYSGHAFAIDRNRANLVTNDPSKQCVIGNRHHLSFRDIQLANLMYNCTELDGCEKKDCPEDGFQGKDCKCWCFSGNLDAPLKECDGCYAIMDSIEEPECKDKEWFCPLLAQMNQCHGVKQDFMAKFCAKSCDVCQCKIEVRNLPPFPQYPDCPEREQQCEDRNDHCECFSNMGACLNQPYFMLNNCKKSCDACDLDYKQECRDVSPFCEAYELECCVDGFVDYLSSMCRKTCRLC